MKFLRLFAGLCVPYAVMCVSPGGGIEMKDEMLKSRFGIEIEMTGITRSHAAEVVARTIGGTVEHRPYDGYDKRFIQLEDGRKWTVMSDSSIIARRTLDNGTRVDASSEYRVELVSPILTYEEDFEMLQSIVRALREAGAYANQRLQCGIHIHLDGEPHNAKTIKNFINIIASKNDLLYKSLQITPERMRWCKKMDDSLVEKIKRRRPKTEEQIKKIWYEGYWGDANEHYHDSRYHFLNLHSYFTGNHTVELRGFNSELHAGKIRAYIILALALNYQALTQSGASSRKPQTENEKFAMRTYLTRLGLNGDDYKSCRMHLCKHLNGTGAWRFGYPPKKKAIA